MSRKAYVLRSIRLAFVIYCLFVAISLFVPNRGCGPLLKSKASRIAADGRQIAFALANEAVDREPEDKPPPWPQEGQFRTSTDYFNYLIQSNVLVDFTPNHFRYRSPWATYDKAILKPEENLWCMTVGVNYATRAGTPILFTRNAAFCKPPGEATLNDISGISAKAVRGLPALVVVYKDGAARIIMPKQFDSPDFKTRLFNPSKQASKVLSP
jgi:hypothetical protein